MDSEHRRQIEQACRNLIAALVHHYDHGEAGQAARLFVPDGLWIKTGVPYRGTASIIESFAKQPTTLVMRHFTSNIVVDVHDAENASAVTYYLAFIGDRGHLPADAEIPIELPRSLGEWNDTFVLTSNGWRFARREGRRIFGARASANR
jgi:hypothetical protein